MAFVGGFNEAWDDWFLCDLIQIFVGIEWCWLLVHVMRVAFTTAPHSCNAMHTRTRETNNNTIDTDIIHYSTSKMHQYILQFMQRIINIIDNWSTHVHHRYPYQLQARKQKKNNKTMQILSYSSPSQINRSHWNWIHIPSSIPSGSSSASKK